MINSFYLPMLAFLLASSSFLVATSAQSAQNIGSFYECAHSLKGNVWVVNDREIMIQGFHYDGLGPAAWFHGQLRPAQGISTADPNGYVTLPYPNDTCERLTPGQSYKDANITLILPRSIKEFHTIGVFCYQFCHNFGHVIIPENLSVPQAPLNHLAVSDCQKPSYNACPSPANGALEPNCKGGALSAPMEMPSNENEDKTPTLRVSNEDNTNKSAGTPITSISVWFLFSLLLLFRTM